MHDRRTARAALLHLKRCNDKPLVFDGDTHALSGFKAGGLDPSPRKLHPRKEGRTVAYMGGAAGPPSDSASAGAVPADYSLLNAHNRHG
jgi:hypothetical protein